MSLILPLLSQRLPIRKSRLCAERIWLKGFNFIYFPNKRKCGIDVGEHYNISQKENQKVPQCPKEKEDAIRAALEHFAMI